MIEELLQQAIAANAELVESDNTPSPANQLTQHVPTLLPDFYRPLSPMLRARFAAFGAWREATHANWLSFEQMQALWPEQPRDEEMEQIRKNIQVVAENWANDAVALFKPERVSVFAAAREGNERLYLVWFDCIEEPEIWAYDTSGEAHYQNLATYLQAYIDDDLAAYSKHWILGNSQE